MVKLTTKYLFRKISKKNQIQPRKKSESDLEYLNRITHLNLQSQFIDKISVIPECQSVSVIYLQNNLLQSINNLESFPNVTHLYLQHNYINRIENLSKLKFLKKLYLGYNEISVVEDLEGLNYLTELHLESQRLPQGETLYFDPRTLNQLKTSLKVLNLSNNNISSIQCLSEITSLSKLLVENNDLMDVEDLMEALAGLPVLEELHLEGNPIANDRKLLDYVVVASASLKTLDGRDIDEQTRTFITNLAYNRECRRRLSELSDSRLDSRNSFSESKDKPSFDRTLSNASYKLGSKLFPVINELKSAKKGLGKASSLISYGRQLPSTKSSVKESQAPTSTSFYL